MSEHSNELIVKVASEAGITEEQALASMRSFFSVAGEFTIANDVKDIYVDLDAEGDDALFYVEVEDE